MPLVSVITPAYNAASHISETIESVKSQTAVDWEMLIIDDASNDSTLDTIRATASGDERIIVLALDRSAGPAKARNVGLERARGRYICFLDADDLWLPEKIERQLSFMENGDHSISCTGYRRISEDGRTVGQVIMPPAQITYDILLKNTAIANLTAMADRERTGDIRLPDTGHEDYALWLSLLRRGIIAYGLGQDLARYRVVRGSRSSRLYRSASWVWRIYRKQEGLGIMGSAWCLAHYAARAALKRRML